VQKQFLAYLKKRGLKTTGQRQRILNEFLALNKHVSAEELVRIIKKKDPSIGQATVFRSMKLLVEAGVAQTSGLADERLFMNQIKNIMII